MNLSKNELVHLICKYVGCEIDSVRCMEIEKFIDDTFKQSNKTYCIYGKEDICPYNNNGICTCPDDNCYLWDCSVRNKK